MKTAYILIVGMRVDLLLWRIFPGAEWLATSRLAGRSEIAERSQANTFEGVDIIYIVVEDWYC